MKVILLQDVKSLGKKDAIVEVSDGYGRNYLIPKGLATEASKGNINDINNKKEAEKVRKAKEEANAKQIASEINGKTYVLKAKTGDSGKLFGAISNRDVAEVVSAQAGIELDKKKVELKEPIKNVGLYEVEAKIYTGVSAKFNVKVETR